jgi:hypothetical protein
VVLPVQYILQIHRIANPFENSCVAEFGIVLEEKKWNIENVEAEDENEEDFDCED